MNRLPRDKQIQIINALVEGCSIRSIERMYDVHRDTITRLMVRTGQNCMSIMDETIRDVPAGVVQCDEIWTYVRKKDRRLNKTERRKPSRGHRYVCCWAKSGIQYASLSSASRLTASESPPL